MLSLTRNRDETILCYMDKDGPFLRPLLITNRGHRGGGSIMMEFALGGVWWQSIVPLESTVKIWMAADQLVIVKNSGNDRGQKIGIEAPASVQIVRAENLEDSTPPATRGRMTRATDGTAKDNCVEQPAVRVPGGVDSTARTAAWGPL